MIDYYPRGTEVALFRTPIDAVAYDIGIEVFAYRATFIKRFDDESAIVSVASAVSDEVRFYRVLSAPQESIFAQDGLAYPAYILLHQLDDEQVLESE